MERKDTMANTQRIQSSRNTDLEHSETIGEKGNEIIKKKHATHPQTQAYSAKSIYSNKLWARLGLTMFGTHS